MAHLPLVSCFGILILAICSAIVEPAPYIIGGGWNTDIDEDDSSELNPGMIKSVISSLKHSNFHDNLPSKVDAKFVSETKDEGETNSDVTENKSNPWVDRIDQIPGVKLPPPPMSGLEQVNPLFRQKRQACQIPANLGQYVNQLQSRLNATQFLGRSSNQPSRPIVPSNQPNACPSQSNPWWPKPEPNLSSNCPWTLSELDLGEKAYPRYFLEATCLCDTCIHAPLMGCMNIRQEVTYFEREGCQDGLALMTKKTIQIVVGCTCVHAAPNGVTPAGTTEAPLPDDY